MILHPSLTLQKGQNIQGEIKTISVTILLLLLLVRRNEILLHICNSARTTPHSIPDLSLMPLHSPEGRGFVAVHVSDKKRESLHDLKFGPIPTTPTRKRPTEPLEGHLSCSPRSTLGSVVPACPITDPRPTFTKEAYSLFPPIPICIPRSNPLPPPKTPTMGIRFPSVTVVLHSLARFRMGLWSILSWSMTFPDGRVQDLPGARSRGWITRPIISRSLGYIKI